MGLSFDFDKSKINPASVNPIPDFRNFICSYYGDLREESDFIQNIYTILNSAEDFLDEYLAQYNFSSMTSKLAIVLDIDETSISNYFSIKEDEFSNDPELINKRYHKTDTPPIKPVLRLFQKAVTNNVAVFFITARKPFDNNPDDNLRAHAIDCLSNAGYNGWTDLFMPQLEEFNVPTATFKTNIRKTLTEQGYKIILNIGDQDSDLEGGYAERPVKIPNFLYGISAHQSTTITSISATSNLGFFKQNERCKNMNINDSDLENSEKNVRNFNFANA